MSNRHKDLSHKMYREQSISVYFSPIVIAVAACRHPNIKLDTHQSKAIAFAWEELQKAARQNESLDWKKRVADITHSLRIAEQQLQYIVELDKIEDHNWIRPETKEDFQERIRVYASWILRQVFEIGEQEDAE